VSTRLLVTLTLIAIGLLALAHYCQAESFDSLPVGEVWGPGVVSNEFVRSPLNALVVPRDCSFEATSLWWTAGERWYHWEGAVWVNPACSAVWVDDLETPEPSGWLVLGVGVLVLCSRVKFSQVKEAT
jgi:hypothetical protein